MPRREPIKILKPYKTARQKNESPTDAAESVAFISNIVNSIGTCKAEVVSNEIKSDSDIITDPNNIVNQMIEVQESTQANPEGKGKRVYSMIYMFPKEYGVDTWEVVDMVEELISKYPEFQSVAVINQTENKDICCGITFNNYSLDGNSKMSKRYRPYHMSNIYNRYIDKRTREEEELYGLDVSDY